MTYQTEVSAAAAAIAGKAGWESISAESVARMRLQNRFQSGLDIARYTAAIMRRTEAWLMSRVNSASCSSGFDSSVSLATMVSPAGTA